MSLKKAAIIHIHGQGGNKEHSSDSMFAGLRDHLEDSDCYHFRAVKYYAPLEKNQKIMIEKLDDEDASFMCIRAILVQAFGDTATIYQDTESYERVTREIKHAILSAKEKIKPNAPIFIIAHSLGSIMISNYIWDMQAAGLCDSQLAAIYTTGSPMHIFLSGIPYGSIKAIDKPCRHFEWINFWNPRDLISSPFGILSSSYQALVEDVVIKKGFIKAHGKYDESKKVFKKIVESIEMLTS